MKFEELRSLLTDCRSCRRYDASHKVSRETLEEVVGLTRLCASGRNIQSLRYRIINEQDETDRLFPLLKWAGYMPEWDGPEPAERPTAYLVQCLDTRYGNDCMCDDGLQLQAIRLGITSLGLASCIVKAFDMKGLLEQLHLPEGLRPLYVLAVGKPAETLHIEDTDGTPDADIRYYRTPDQIFHIPKRPLSELLV